MRIQAIDNAADNAKDTTVGTIRTGVQTTVLTAVAAVMCKVFGWDVQVEDLLPWLPVVAPVALVFYRLSRYLSDKLPGLGYILFGIVKKPAYVDPPAVINDAEGVRVIQKDDGYAINQSFWIGVLVAVVAVLVYIVLIK